VPFLSIILRVHRRPEKLKVTLESILRQTFKDYEVIVITDDPTDTKSHDVIHTYGTQIFLRDNVPKVISVEPLGYPGCNLYLDTGARMATGDFIVYIDDDDMYWDEKYFETLYSIVKEKSQVKMIISVFGYTVPHLGVTEVPNYFLWGKPPQLAQMGTPNICVKTSLARSHKWAATPTGDFEFISACYADCMEGEIYWNDMMAVKTQAGPSFGSTEY